MTKGPAKMADNRRKAKRVANQLSVLYGQDEPIFPGFTRNISLSGLELVGKTIYYPHTTISILIEGAEPIELKGVVRWISDIRYADSKNIKQFMGVDLIATTERYAELVENSVGVFTDKRIEPRFGKVYKVVFDTPEHLMEEYTQDISKGGIFVLTENPPAIGTYVSMQIIIAETGESISAEGEVVHVVSLDQAEMNGANPGIGVQFTSFPGGGKEVLEKFIQVLKGRMRE